VLPGTWPQHNFPLADNEHTVFLELCVVDHGIGISKDNMARLFQAFSQIDSSLARQFQGTGLGLAMVKQLTELQGGAVAVASAEGEGSRFAVWLPLSSSTPDSLVPSIDGAGSELTGFDRRTALVVEADDGAAELVRMLLEAEGFVVVRAADVDDGVALAAEQALSLITLDVDLPGTDGWEFLSRIRADRVLSHVPVVIIASDIDGNLALSDGAAAVLQKPISRAMLRASLANLGLDETRGRTRTVLVVDDDPKAVEVIAALLPAPGYAVVRAYGGREAITLAKRVAPDLILLDLMMPDVNGFDVVEALQRDHEASSIPILVVTAKHVSAQDRALLSCGPNQSIKIVEKAGFNRSGFMAEVWRALGATERSAADGESIGG
jgi:CheY-like chemotaxis protein